MSVALLLGRQLDGLSKRDIEHTRNLYDWRKGLVKREAM